MSLVAEPEIDGQIRNVAMHREPLAGRRSDHDKEQTHKPKIYTAALVLRFVARQQRRHIEPCRKPGCRDPQDRQLGMPGAGDCIGQVIDPG